VNIVGGLQGRRLLAQRTQMFFDILEFARRVSASSLNADRSHTLTVLHGVFFRSHHLRASRKAPPAYRCVSKVFRSYSQHRQHSGDANVRRGPWTERKSEPDIWHRERRWIPRWLRVDQMRRLVVAVDTDHSVTETARLTPALPRLDLVMNIPPILTTAGRTCYSGRRRRRLLNI